MRRLVMIYNDTAGSAGDEARAAALDGLQQGADVVEAVIDHPDKLQAVLAEHPDRDPVVVGGDGSIHCLVTALAERGELDARTVGVIPLGTGNDLARTLGIPPDIPTAARIIVAGHERRMDLLRDDAGEIAVNAVHLGIGAEASRAAVPLKPWLRRFAYAVGSVAVGFRAPGWKLRVRVDGRLVADGRRRVLMVAVGNGATIGGGALLHPDAEPDDGIADVMISLATGPLERLWYGVLLRRGSHSGHRKVRTQRGVEIAVAGEPTPLNVDGELLASVSRRTWRLEPAAWRITAPAEGWPPSRRGARAQHHLSEHLHLGQARWRSIFTNLQRGDTRPG
ncbi:MAG: diacylglycerol/lipid kinase family protein [Micromonosporaceae bacterium]